jgi:hypothetical protein
MTRNIATGDSSGYNFSSAKLDRSLYYKAVGINQSDLEVECEDRVFWEWWHEFRETPEAQVQLSVEILAMEMPPHEYHWDQPIDADPAKTSAARDTNLKNGMTSYHTEFAAMGLDAETEHRKLANELGIEYEDLQEQLRMYLNNGVVVPLKTKSSTVPGSESIPSVESAPVQDTALNGAQIRDGLLAIIDKVVLGQLPIDAARAIVRISFPSIPQPLVDAALLPLNGFKPTQLVDGVPVESVSNETRMQETTDVTQENKPTPGVFVGTKRRDFTNNLKQIQQVINALIDGSASEALTRISLERLGLSSAAIQALIDDASDGKIDDSAEVME